MRPRRSTPRRSPAWSRRAAHVFPDRPTPSERPGADAREPAPQSRPAAVDTQTSLPSASASTHQLGACSSETRVPPAARAASTRPGPSSTATETSTWSLPRPGPRCVAVLEPDLRAQPARVGERVLVVPCRVVPEDRGPEGTDAGVVGRVDGDLDSLRCARRLLDPELVGDLGHTPRQQDVAVGQPPDVVTDQRERDVAVLQLDVGMVPGQPRPPPRRAARRRAPRRSRGCGSVRGAVRGRRARVSRRARPRSHRSSDQP